jgi:hypothetical protein
VETTSYLGIRWPEVAGGVGVWGTEEGDFFPEEEEHGNGDGTAVEQRGDLEIWRGRKVRISGEGRRNRRRRRRIGEKREGRGLGFWTELGWGLWV